LNPADPFIAGQRRNIRPSRQCFWIEFQRVFQIFWKIMDDAARRMLSSVMVSA
jgi:hypothetical protein